MYFSVVKMMQQERGLADWHIHREPSPASPLSPAVSLIGFAATRYRGQPPGLHLFLILASLIVNLSDTCRGLSCLSLFQVWGGRGGGLYEANERHFKTSNCRSPPPPSCHTTCAPMPITLYLANTNLPSNHWDTSTSDPLVLRVSSSMRTTPSFWYIGPITLSLPAPHPLG